MNLGGMIKEGNQASLQDCEKVLIFLCQDLYEGLKNEYLIVNGPFTLWNDLRQRYDHQKNMIIQKLDMTGCTWGCKILKLLVNITPHFSKSTLN